MSQKFLRMGALGKPHGVQGELFADWQAENPLPEDGIIYLRLEDGNIRPFEILSVRPHKNRLLLYIDGIKDRDMAEKLKGAEILMPREALPDLEADEAYVADLIGCETMLQDGTHIGILDHVEYPAGQEVWAIKNPNGKEILFPAQRKFLISFDLAERRIVIDPPPGLLEIYNA